MVSSNLSQAQVEAFLQADKVLLGPMVWASRTTAAADLAILPVEMAAVEAGSVVAIQKPGSTRDWTFQLKVGREQVLRWDFKPEGVPRRHRNPLGRPADFLAADRALIHEHPWDQRWAPDLRLSRGLVGLEEHDHRQAYRAFCDHANIDHSTVEYVAPPEPQLLLLS